MTQEQIEIVKNIFAEYEVFWMGSFSEIEDNWYDFDDILQDLTEKASFVFTGIPTEEDEDISDTLWFILNYVLKQEEILKKKDYGWFVIN